LDLIIKAALREPLFSLHMKKIWLLALSISGLVVDVSAQMNEEATVRSSHPRGIASDGRPAQRLADRPAVQPPNTAVRSNTSSGTSSSSPSTAAATTQAGHESINISGSTRIDARSSEGTATAIGQKNTAGNRVGGIGGREN
jgi:hypothetical protein